MLLNDLIGRSAYNCCNSNIGIIETNDNELSSDPQIIADIFQRTFFSYFTFDNFVIPATSGSKSNPNLNLSSIDFSDTLIRKAIVHIEARSAGGPNGIPSILF